MKTTKRDQPATNEPFEHFKRFAKALVAVPKTEIDHEAAKEERKKKAIKQEKTP